jgi:S-adenosyl methyltransferase
VAVMHFIADEEDPAGLIGQLVAGLPSGSYLALSHATVDSRPESVKGERAYDRATVQAHARSREQVQAMVTGLELVDPGLVWAPQWRPEPGAEPDPDPGRSHVYVVVGRKP